MEREVILKKARALIKTVKTIETSNVKDRVIVDSCNTLIQEAKAIKKAELIDLQKVSWDENSNSVSKTEINFNLTQIIAVLKPEWGIGVTSKI